MASRQSVILKYFGKDFMASCHILFAHEWHRSVFFHLNAKTFQHSTPSHLVLHCWGRHLQLLLPPLLPDLDHHPGLVGHQGAQALLHSELVDQEGLAGLQGVHQLLPGLQPVPGGGAGAKMERREKLCLFILHN